LTCTDDPVNDDSGQLIACGNNVFCCAPDAQRGLCNCTTNAGTFSLSSAVAQTIIGVTGLQFTQTPTVAPSFVSSTHDPLPALCFILTSACSNFNCHPHNTHHVDCSAFTLNVIITIAGHTKAVGRKGPHWRRCRYRGTSATTRYSLHFLASENRQMAICRLTNQAEAEPRG